MMELPDRTEIYIPGNVLKSVKGFLEDCYSDKPYEIHDGKLTGNMFICYIAEAYIMGWMNCDNKK